MTALVAASSLLTCLGDGERTFASLLAGVTGVAPLRHPVPGPLGVTAGYHVADGEPGTPFRATELLRACVRQAVAQARLGPGDRVVAIVGTGLRELATVESASLRTAPLPASRLHFGQAVREELPSVGDVITVSNACSAGGHALALAQDMVECGDADAVVVGATDTMTTSMLAMIGRVADRPTDRVRPFDRDRMGVLLGEGAGAVVVVPEGWRGPRFARLVSTGLSCDAYHETAPDPAGIARAVADAYERGRRDPRDVDLVLAHGTGTALNDPVECAVLRGTLLDTGARPLITAVKGALGHMSGAAALANVDIAIRCLRRGVVPPVNGLRTPLDEGAGLPFVMGGPANRRLRLAQCNAFGFGGVNAVTLLEAL